MDLTPPSLITSPASSPSKQMPSPVFANTPDSFSEALTESYPSPQLLDRSCGSVSPFGTAKSVGLPTDFDQEGPIPVLDSTAYCSWTQGEAMDSMSPPMTTTMSAAALATTDYDPFGSYGAVFATSFGNETYPPPPTSALTGHLCPPTPALTDATTSRSSSMATRRSFSGAPEQSLTPAMNPSMPPMPPKLDSRTSYSPVPDQAQFTGPPPSLGPYGTHGLEFSTSHPNFLGQESLAAWPKDGFQPAHLEPPSLPPHASPLPSHLLPSHQHQQRQSPLMQSHTLDQLQGQPQPQVPPEIQPRHVPTSEPRAAAPAKKQRKSRSDKRKPTPGHKANFQCKEKGCGKFFSRSYNFKSHMETHDEKREHPFPCPIEGCTWKFVRKTDLQRHHNSVHMKDRSHKCDYCSRLFARKDTLRRHMEDGCSKRFDIGTMDIRAQSYGAMAEGKSQGQQQNRQQDALTALPSGGRGSMTAVGMVSLDSTAITGTGHEIITADTWASGRSSN